FDAQKSSSNEAGAVCLIEIVNDERAIFSHHRRPWITQILTATVVAQNDFFYRANISAFGIENARANPYRRVTITINEQHAFVRQTQREVRMSLKPGILPLLKTLP